MDAGIRHTGQGEIILMNCLVFFISSGFKCTHRRPYFTLSQTEGQLRSAVLCSTGFAHNIYFLHFMICITLSKCLWGLSFPRLDTWYLPHNVMACHKTAHWALNNLNVYVSLSVVF